MKITKEYLEGWGSAWSDPQRQGLLDFYAPDARYRDVGSDLTCDGHDQLARFHAFMLVFAPDSEIVFFDAYGNDEGFAALWDWSGTATASLRVKDELIPVTGERFSVRGVAHCTLTPEGLLASHADYYDMYDVIRQVRVTSTAEAGASAAPRPAVDLPEM
ncbi:hypothetical protein DSM112329_02789 [Paraconexibacter sp. AEG42_29]|uniref:SnoaL-like domain-containing protein n=1 Tax=Paraconexibacter sp. AEG42_29 TaxID=2997339 RepID=A0AAU7AW57_9ACTN